MITALFLVWSVFFVVFVLFRLRFSICATHGKPIFGFTLQFDHCGCKHFALFIGVVYLRADFGTCKNKPQQQ